MKRILTGLFCLVSILCFTQEEGGLTQGVLPPGPEAASFAKYGDVPVDFSSGTPDISIPITTIKDGPLALPITLRYHASGLKVSEIPSWVGAGWNLHTGGILSRSVQGIADDHPFGWWNHGYNWDITNDDNVADAVRGDKDSEPDIFSYALPSGSGKFYIDKNHDFVQVPLTDNKIEMLGSFSGFVITTTDGTKYYFGADNEGRSARDLIEPSGVEDVDAHIQSWYLLKIESFDGHHSIKYNYANGYHQYEMPGDCRVIRYNGGPCPEDAGGIESTCVTDNSVEFDMDTKILTSITTNTTTVSFNTGSRQDDGEVALQSMDIDEGLITRNVDFNYDYSISGRLTLKDVGQSSGGITIPAHTFQYYSSSMPSSRMSEAIDHWGYYNGATGNSGYDLNIPLTQVPYNNITLTYGGANRETSFSHMLGGTLQRITYPTGGYTDFEFEANKVGESVVIGYNPTYVGGLRIKRISSHDAITNNPVEKTYSYIKEGTSDTASGVLIQRPLYVSANQGVFANGSGPGGSISSAGVLIVTEASVTALSSFEGRHVLYSKVTESINGAGYKNYFFDSSPSSGFSTFPTAPMHLNVYSGKTIKSESRNQSDSLLQESIIIPKNNVYDKSQDYLKVSVYNQQMCSLPNSSGFLAYTMAATTTYNIRTAAYQVERRVETIDNITTTKDYTYDPQDRFLAPISEQVVNSDGDIFRTEYTYPFDCGNTTLVSENIIGRPCEVIQKINGNIVSGNRTLYSGHYMHTQQEIGNNGFTRNKYGIANRNAKGNIVEFRKEHDVPEYIIWGHELQRPIAHVNNSSRFEAAYTSFEISGNTTSAENGGWTINNANSSDFINYGKTGNIALKIGKLRSGSNTITKYIYTSGMYNISYWYKSYKVKINGVLHGPSASGWTYYNTDIYLSAGSTITLSGGGKQTVIDELRLMPSDAQMTTYNFDSNTLNAISINDLNSKPTKYIYDDFQRLKYVVDYEGNYVTANTYNYQISSGGTIVNSINSYSAQIEGLTASTILSNTNNAQVMRQTTYLDGLGRSIQSVSIKGSPTSKDIITINEFDALGRQWKSYLPYTFATSNGAYTQLSTAKSRQQSFLSGFYGSTDKDFGYSENKYEAAPLNRVIEQGNPGNALKINGGHSNTAVYRSNNTSEVWNFKDWTWYPSGSLRVTESRDGNRTGTSNAGYIYSYTDKVGREVASNASGRITYKIYDDYGRMEYIIPPKEANSRSGHNWSTFKTTFAGKIYRYTYDNLNRMVSKDLPAQGINYIYYDRLDRVVMNKDANGLKMVTKYDILSRPVLSGIYTGTGLPSVSQSLYETKTTSGNGYTTNQSFPASGMVVHSATYYDDYSYPGAKPKVANTPMKVYANIQPCRGMQTGSRTGVLSNVSNTATPIKYMIGSVYYDLYARPNYTHNDNHVGSGYDQMWTEYDFDGDVMETKHIQNAYSTTTTEVNRFTYDHTGRQLNHYVRIGSSSEFLLSQKAYKETEQLAYNRLGNNAQQIDYDYNINGWLIEINDLNNVGSDFFAQKMNYYSGTSNPQYNGNVAGLQWYNSGHSSVTENFSYDNINRLIGSTTTGSIQGTTYSYDDNGNLNSLTRMNGSNLIDDLSYTYNSLGQLSQLEEDGLLQVGQGFWSNDHDGTFSYDANGNMTADNHKGLTIDYNQFNIPKKFDFGTNEVEITYDATGDKLKKETTGSLSKDYISGFEYENNVLQKIYHEDGWIEFGPLGPIYKFFIKDHLGNTRVTFRVIGGTVTKETDHAYYPFGMEKSIGGVTDAGQLYLYNGKELNSDFNLDWLDYGARWYDASIARFSAVDPLAEDYTMQNSYVYAANNPIRFIDYMGMGPSDGGGETHDEWVDRVNSEWNAIDSGANPFAVWSVSSTISSKRAEGETPDIGVGIDAFERAKNYDPLKSAMGIAIPIAGASAGSDSPAVGLGDAVGLAILTGALVEGLARRATDRYYITYVKYNSITKQSYFGRSSGYGDPISIMRKRDASHKILNMMGFGPARLDQWMLGSEFFFLSGAQNLPKAISAYSAIRGREQQLMDALGGVGSSLVANKIRGVSKINPFGIAYHVASNVAFGNLAPYSGIYLPSYTR